jgi:hypothetical protein
MKKRRIVQVEELEGRVAPDVAIGRLVPALIQTPSHSISNESIALLKPLTTDNPSEHAAGAADLPQDVSYVAALGKLFSNSQELEKIIRPETQSIADGHAPPGVRSEVSAEAALSAWRFLSNYSRKAISNDEARYGSLPDHEDLIHQIYVEYLQQVRNDDGDLARLTNTDSAERQVLRKTVRRVLDHARYEYAKQRRMVELTDQPASANAAEQDWIDLQIDAATGTLQLGARERRLLELRREGMTFEEIGSEMGLLKQRVCEMYNSTVSNLQEIYCS